MTEDDITRENEFIFSTSSYKSLNELHIIKNKTYIYTKTESFMSKSIFSFIYSLIEVNHDNKIFYFIAFTYTNSVDGDSIYLKKFGFKSFNLDDINNYGNIIINDNNRNRIIHLFNLEDLKTLVLVHNKNDNYIACKFYDYNLNEQGSELKLDSNVGGVFFKSVQIPDNQRAFIIFFNNNPYEFYINIYQFSKDIENSIIKTDILLSQTT